MTKNNHSQQGAAAHGLFTPSTILTNLPGILGYYPTDSLVFVCLYDSTDTTQPDSDSVTTTMTIGPVFRLDILEMHRIPDIADAMESVAPDLVMMFVVTSNRSGLAEALPDYLMHAVSCEMMPVLGCWCVDEISTGVKYTLLFGNEEFHKLGLDGVFSQGSPFRDGTVGEITESVTMRELVKAGELPELTRAEAYSFFDRTTKALEPMTIYKLNELTGIRANQLGELVSNNAHMMDEARQALLCRLKECEGFSAEELMEDEDAIEFFGTYFRVLRLRDVIIMASFGMEDTVRNISLAVARTLPDQARANALCCYALCVLGSPTSHRLMPALSAAQKEEPGHRLSQLMTLGYTRGGSELLAEVMYKGAVMDMADGDQRAVSFAARSVYDFIVRGGSELKANLLPQLLELLDVDVTDPLPGLCALIDQGHENAA